MEDEEHKINNISMTKDSVDDEVKVQAAKTPPIKDSLNETNQDTMVTLEKT
jgi:hypothetical protein